MARLSGRQAVRRRRLARRQTGLPVLRQPGAKAGASAKAARTAGERGGEARLRLSGRQAVGAGGGDSPARRVCPRSANGAGDPGFTAREARTGARRRRGAPNKPAIAAAGGLRRRRAKRWRVVRQARRARGPSFGGGLADRSAEARNARSRRIGEVGASARASRERGGEPDGEVTWDIPDSPIRGRTPKRRPRPKNPPPRPRHSRERAPAKSPLRHCAFAFP